MNKVITAQNVHMFAYVSDEICIRPIKGVAIDFRGLGNQEMHSLPTERAAKFAAQGILYIIPYQNPWSWMNAQTVHFADEVIAAALERCGAPDAPVVAMGGSMGGLAALVYTRYARRTPVLCLANCPVCDLPYHYTERPDLPRTLLSAFGTYDCDTLEQAMQTASPLHLALRQDMPVVRYVVFHCEQDEAVNKQMHSDRFVQAMSAYCPVEYHAVPERGHCDLSDEANELYEMRVMQALCGE